MSNLLNQITGNKGKTDLNPIELDSYVESIVSEYVGSYLRNRIYLARSANADIKEDKGYTTIVEFLAYVNNELNFIRMWSLASMKDEIWPRIINDENILRFVFKGTTNVSVRSFASDEQFNKLVTHVAGALSCLSFGENDIIDDAAFVDVLPRNDELVSLFMKNQWALFLYYLTRLDIISIVTGGGSSNEQRRSD